MRGFGAWGTWIAVVAPLAGRLADGIGTRWLAASGMGVLSAGLVLLWRLDARSSTLDIVVFQLVAAVGSGLFQAPNNSALMGAAPPDRQGIAAGILATGRVVGQTLSVAVAGAVFVAHGFSAAMLACAAFAAVAIGTSLLRGSEHLRYRLPPR